jgi:RimJ/RimL family protein N-acetyltransferase
MGDPREHQASGLEYLDLVTKLLQRARLADETAGLWEAADLQWWWRKARRSDEIGQMFWLDGSGPVAAAILTDWGRGWGCDPIVCTGVSDSMLPRVWSRALARIDSLALERVEVGVGDDDAELLELLVAAGFSPTGEKGAATWMLPTDRPRVPTLPDGYRLLDRTQTSGRPHHMTGRSGEEVAERLAQSPLYRPELDLFVEASNGEVASYGLFWFDPITEVGLVEPMGTGEHHRRLGLARFVLASGLERLAALGSRRLKVNYEASNVASRNLYLGAGFRPESTSCVYSRRPFNQKQGIRTGRGPSSTVRRWSSTNGDS